jgi:aspartyl-tRNA(Asn)/glutamyl-tRNA(Gln) amidotransferase subunit C
VQVGHHKIAFKRILHFYIVAYSPKIISQVQKTCGPYTTHYYLFALAHKAAKIRIVCIENNPLFTLYPCQKPLSKRRIKTPRRKLYLWPMEVNDAMVDKLAHLAKMIAFVEKLNELDTTGVEPLLHMTDEINVLRKDEVKGSVSREEALKNAPLHDGEFFKVPKAIRK